MKMQGGNACCRKDNASKFGFFRRVSDGRTLQRYRCNTCRHCFSQASFDPAYYQKKRHINTSCAMMLASCVSMRRSAKILGVHPITVARKLVYMGTQCRLKTLNMQDTFKGIAAIQFDELQTIEHTKCKPLSVAVAVSEKRRKILGFKVSIMPATGHLASISRKKYGPRKDKRLEGMKVLFEGLKTLLSPTITIKSDQCAFYGSVVSQYFPKARHCQFKGEKSAVIGQGELKKTRRDPLFYINHTLAMLRANINRLVRRSWCTTKQIARLEHHLAIYMWVHNTQLTSN